MVDNHLLFPLVVIPILPPSARLSPRAGFPIWPSHGLRDIRSSLDSRPRKVTEQEFSGFQSLLPDPFSLLRGLDGGFPHLQGALHLIGSGASAGPQLHSNGRRPVTVWSKSLIRAADAFGHGMGSSSTDSNRTTGNAARREAELLS